MDFFKVIGLVFAILIFWLLGKIDILGIYELVGHDPLIKGMNTWFAMLFIGASYSFLIAIAIFIMLGIRVLFKRQI